MSDSLAVSASAAPPTVPSSGGANRDAIVKYALSVEGPITTVVYDAVKQAIAQGALHARMPEKTTLYRWLRGIHPSSRDRSVSGEGRDGQGDFAVRPSAPATADTNSVVVPDSPQELQPRIELTELRLNMLGALLLEHGLFEPYRNDHKIMLKWLGRSRTHSWSPRDLEQLLLKIDATIATYVRVLKGAGVEPPTAIAIAPSTHLVPVADNDEATTVCGVQSAQAATTDRPMVDPRSMPVFTGPTGSAAEGQWGVLAAQAPAATYGMVVGHVETPKTEKDAHIRARLLAPVLSGTSSLTECAAAWRRAFRGEGGAEGKMLVHGIDPDHCIAYRNITARTLRRWRDRVIATRKLAAEAGAETELGVSTILEHRQTGLRQPRKATPDLIDLVVKTFTEQKNWSKAKVARHVRNTLGIDVSDRLVQSILALELSDKERALARGGDDAVDVVFRRRLLREAKYPNRTWIMDHSFLRQEITLPEYQGQVADYDFEFEYYTFGSGVKKRVRGLWLSLIMDACTRRVLAIRVWDKAPTSRDTLLVLRDAIERFGLPEILYTDNGSDLNSHLVREALDAAGIHHVNSQPYTPQGRGKIERMFRTIKEKVLVGMEGYYGGRHGAIWGDSDLLTLDEVQARIWAGIDSLMNNVKHTPTNRIPTVHYEEEIGARRLRNVGPLSAAPEAMLVLLLVHRDVLNRTSGFQFAGRHYYSPCLGDVPNGARLIVHYDPAHLEVVHVSVEGAAGSIVYIGVAEYYDKNHEPPTFVEQQRVEADWARANEQHRERRRIAREQVVRLEGHRAAGELVGIAAAEAVAQESGLILSAPATKMLPAGRPSTDQDAETTPVSPDAYTSTAPIDELVIGGSSDPECDVDDVVDRAVSGPSGTVPVPSRRSGRNAAVIVTMPWD